MSPLDHASRQKELEIKNSEINATFQTNLEFFRIAAPNIYEEYKNYSPNVLRLMFSNEGYINLVNTSKESEPVYPEDPAEYFRKYLSSYEKHSKVYRIEFDSSSNKIVDKESHNYHADQIVDFLNKELPPEEKYALDKDISLMIILGVGLGYHVLPLLQKANIKNLVIIEPNKDIFYASLHTLDWTKVNAALSEPGHSLNIQIGQSEEKATNALRQSILDTGPYIAAKTFLVEHIHSEQMASTTKYFLDRLSSTASTLGYFDDERIGLAHTLSNIKRRIPCLRPESPPGKPRIDIPVFILGNGPSLDEAIEFLLENKDKAIIISCGTTIGSLEKIGLKPDIHVEQERPRFIYEWLKMSTTEKFRKGITMIGLNTVHPKVFSLFEKTAMAMKPSDVGLSYSLKLSKNEARPYPIPYCNPTVTNAGTSIAIALGFSNIYLFGVDFGFSPKGEHHSKFSSYYDVKKEFNESVNQVPDRQNIVVPGNFCEEIETTMVLNASRNSMEGLISESSQARFFNTSNGARITGAEPKAIDALRFLDELPNKSEVIESLYKNNFRSNLFSAPKSDAQISRDFSVAKNLYEKCIDILNRDVESRKSGMEIVEQLQNLFKMTNNMSLEELFSIQITTGSANIFHTLLQCALTRSNNEESTMKAYNFAKSEYLAFLKSAITQMRSGFLEHDRREANLAEKFIGKS